MYYDGYLKKKTKINEYNSYSEFILVSNGEEVTITGLLPDYPLYTPLRVTIKENPDGSLSSTKTELYSGERECTVKFLSSDNFSGIGKATAEKITDNTDIEIFSFVKDLDESDYDLYGKNAASAFRIIAKLLSFEELCEFVMSNNGNLYTARKIFAALGKRSMENIHDNPYIYFRFGGEYSTSEALAHKAGIKVYDRRRTKALVKWAMDANRSFGNTRMTFHELVRLCHRKERECNEGYHTDALFIAEEINTNDAYIIGSSYYGLYVALKSDDISEKLIAGEIKRLENSKVAISDGSVTVDNIEKASGIRYSKGQKEVLEGIKTSGVKIITGGPGTGKTTLLNGLLYRYSKENPDMKIMLAAPTGCAAHRMTESCHMPAVTIHKLLDIRPYERDITDYKRDMLPADLIVVDETSMLDEKLAATLLSAVKNNATVIFLGDKDQLPSVDAGAVLADMIGCGYLEHYNLTEIFRQKTGSLITENAHRIVSGDPELEAGREFLIKEFKDEDTLIENLLYMEKHYKESGSKGSLRVFTPSKNRKFKSGSIALNRMIKKEISDREEDFAFGYYSYSVGDQIIFTRNNYDIGYYNGAEGKIVSVTKINSSINVGIDVDGEYISIGSGELPDIEPAFAMTAHKAQGSECDYAVIVVPKNPKGLLLRKLLYVEVTRAKKQVVILSEGESYKKAIISSLSLNRRTGLKERLQGVFNND